MTRRRWRFGGGRVSVQGAEMPVLLWEPRPVPPLGVIPQEPWPEREVGPPPITYRRVGTCGPPSVEVMVRDKLVATMLGWCSGQVLAVYDPITAGTWIVEVPGHDAPDQGDMIVRRRT